MSYQDVLKPERIKGLKIWKNPKNRFVVAMLHYSANPNKDPERDGKQWYENERVGMPKVKWNKEYEIDFSTKSGKLVFGPELSAFDKNIHFINSFELPEPYDYLLSLDFGQRNPTGALVGAWTPENRLYIIDEYYKAALPSVTSREMFKQFEPYLGDMEGKSLREKKNAVLNTFQIRIIDPTTRSKNRSKIKDGEEIAYSVIEDFEDHGWEFEPGNNDVDTGITRIREYLELDSNKQCHLYIFKDKCPNLCIEFENYRYKELTELQQKTKNSSEEVIKKDDHLVDALRYMVMTRPNKPEEKEKEKTRIQKDIESLCRPVILDDSFDAS